MTSEERKIVNRQRILNTAVRLFTQQGIMTTTIGQIAKASHVVQKTVLNIFGTKDNLVVEVMAHLSQQIMAELSQLTAQRDYQELTGLAQILFLQKERARTLSAAPAQWLLMNEVMIWLARSKPNSDLVTPYMENLEYLFCIFDKALDKGMRDGTICPRLDKHSVLFSLVPAFRAILEHLAQVKLNDTLSRFIDAEKEIQIYLELLCTELASEKLKNERGNDTAPV